LGMDHLVFKGKESNSDVEYIAPYFQLGSGPIPKKVFSLGKNKKILTKWVKIRKDIPIPNNYRKGTYV